MTSPEQAPAKCTIALADPEAAAIDVLSALAAQTGLPILPAATAAKDYCQFILFFHNARLSLQSTDEGAAGAVCVDFDNASLQYRQRRPMQPEALLKAAGVKHGQSCQVLDATAGFGLDAFLFASAGAQVILIERSAILHAMLADGLARGAMSADDKVRSAVARMRLLHGDSAAMMLEQGKMPVDIVYLDPMFPERKKSAKVKKNMALLQKLLHSEAQAEHLLANALQLANKRVVVKRPRHAPFLEERKPSFSQEGKSSRFDVYLCTENAKTAKS